MARETKTDDRKRISLPATTGALHDQLCKRDGRNYLTPVLQYVWEHPGFPTQEVQPSTLVQTPIAARDTTDLLTALHLTDEETKSIQQALAATQMTLETFLHVAAVKEATRHKHMTAMLATRDIDDPDQRMRVRGSGLAYVATAVQDLMAANLRAHAAGSRDVAYLTRGLVATETGTNRRDINLYFDSNQAVIDAHNRRLGFTSPEEGRRHNLSRGKRLVQEKRGNPGE